MTIPKKFLIAALVAASALVAVEKSQAQISIELGDRGYYTHGDSYSYNGGVMVWSPGHWGSHHRWIHGHYVRRERGWRRGWHARPGIHIGL